MKRPPKNADVLRTANESIVKGRYRATFHSECRQKERDITLKDALYVIKTGYRDLSHDQYKEEWWSWNYAIHGKNLQGDKLRIIISFDEEFMLIITVINLITADK